MLWIKPIKYGSCCQMI